MPDEGEIFQPSVVAYRLGSVEKTAERNTEQIGKLTENVDKFVAAAPGNFVPRGEYDERHTNLMRDLDSLATTVDRFIAGSSTQFVLRENFEEYRRESRDVTQRWRLAIFSAAIAILVALIGLTAVILQHG